MGKKTRDFNKVNIEKLTDENAEAQCALCLKKVDHLSKSHIISDFLYKPVYEEGKHSFKKISTDPSKRQELAHSGIYERLLCKHCEGRVGKWETYASKVMMDGIGFWFQQEKWGFTIRGVEYAPFKLFGMSLLWRAAVSKLPEFSSVQLGPHEEKLRKMLDAEDPGQPYEYGFSIVFPPDPKAREIFSHAISPPQPFRHGAHRGYRFMLGMTSWLFLVSNHMHAVNPEIFSLHSDGTLRIRSGGSAIMEYLHSFSAEIAGAKEKRRINNQSNGKI